ncbi:hypothetical protein OSTOST_21581 [Ostertagia ostertagi]
MCVRWKPLVLLQRKRLRVLMARFPLICTTILSNASLSTLNNQNNPVPNIRCPAKTKSPDVWHGMRKRHGRHPARKSALNNASEDVNVNRDSIVTMKMSAFLTALFRI